MKRIGLMIVLLGAVLWIAGCGGKSEPAKPAEPTEPTEPAEKPAQPSEKPAEKPAEQPTEKPAEQPTGQPDEAAAPAEGGPDGKKVTGAVGSALFKGLTGGSSEQPEPDPAPTFDP